MKYKEVKGDLFKNQVAGSMLVQCISSDAAMGAGIAVEFNKRFPGMKDKLEHSILDIGEVHIWTSRTQFVANLITKEKYWYKPTRENLETSITNLKKIVVANNIRTIQMPKIGAGLDRLAWHTTRGFIQELFKDVNVNIEVYYL